MKKIGFLYEHPTWSERLIECFGENGIELELIRIDQSYFDTARLKPDFDLLINRVNIMPSAGRDNTVAFHTLHYLNWLELGGTRIINGAKAHYIGASKAMQNGIFVKLGLDFPQAIAIGRAEDAAKAAERIGYPVIVKPNIGGSGNGIARFDTAAELQLAIKTGSIDLGVDGTGIVQEYVPSDGYVYRVELLGGELFYSIRQRIIENQFNYCAADGCSVDQSVDNEEEGFDFCAIDNAGRIETFAVPDAILQQVISICDEAGADVGGVEYFIRQEGASPCFYDFNPYSNFISDGETLLGFSPEQRYMDFVLSELKKLETGAAVPPVAMPDRAAEQVSPT